MNDLTIEELITCLQNEEQPGIGYHPTMTLEGFLCTADVDLKSGILHHPKVVHSPILAEIVGRGTRSLPALLGHMSDSRPTKIVITKPFSSFGGIWFSDEYDARFSNLLKTPPNVNQSREAPCMGSYRLRVGDLCYVAVGQIVNRDLRCVRYQPSANVVINSPVEYPDLGEAVKLDWGSLDDAEHLQSLLQDFTMKNRKNGAIARLRHFYPKVDPLIDN